MRCRRNQIIGMRYTFFYALFVFILSGSCSQEQGQAASSTATDLETFLQGKRLEYLVTSEELANRALGVAINFIDTSFCFLTYYNGLEEPERIQPYKLVARWNMTEGPTGPQIAVRSQLFNFDLEVLSFDASSCQLETEVQGVNRQVKGLFQSRQMPEGRYQARKKKLQGEWAGNAIEGLETISLNLDATTAQIRKGQSAPMTTPWHLSYDGRYIILPESEEAVMLSQDAMGLPVSELGKMLYLTFISTKSAVYEQYRVEKTPVPEKI